MEDHAARPTEQEAPTVVRRPRLRLKIAAFLVASVAVSWLYSSQVAKNVEMTFPRETGTGSDLAQVKQQAPQQDRDKAEKQVRDLTTDLAQVKQALLDRDKAEKQVREPTAELTQVKQALQQDRDKTEKQIAELTTALGASQAGAQQDRDKPRSRSAT